MSEWLGSGLSPEDATAGWTRSGRRILVLCMLLLGASAAWLLLTRPVHRIEGDFLEREDNLVADAWLLEQASNPVAEIRARAYLAIARIQGRSALDALLAATSDPAPSVRAKAAFAVGNLMDRRTAVPAPDAEAANAMLGLLADDERIVVTRAVEALGKMGWAEAAADVTRTAAPIATAMTALMRMDAADQSGFVAEYLDSDDQDSRWAAALAVANLRLAKVPLVWERLWPLVTDDNDFVRAAALQAVAGGEAAEEMLDLVRGNLDHRDPKVRHEAAAALEAFSDSPPPAGLLAGEPYLPARGTAVPQGRLLASGDYQPLAKTLGARLRMRTPLGDFEIELDYDQAPLTSEHFRRLASQGALDGTAFVAVRPNGYAVASASLAPLRSELNPNPFLRGSLGLLRQGLASGGGFFLCQTALPLADGRYVNFGRLVSGDTLLDRLVPGTEILSVRELR